MLSWRTILLLLVSCRLTIATPNLLDSKEHHLRSGDKAEWEEFANRTPDGHRLDVQFQAEGNLTESTLFIRQVDVKQDWNVELNGKRLGKLFLMEYPLVFALPVPKRTLRAGSNTLSILPPKENDDVLIQRIELDARPLREALGDCVVNVTVRERRGGDTAPYLLKAAPCRITVTDTQSVFAPLQVLGATDEAAGRPGVVYTSSGKARIGLLSGDYVVYASRGPEYSLARTNVHVNAGKPIELDLELSREVSTPGLVSCDTHIHTFSYARHGDATIQERMLTIAGEALELPISTEHNQLIDFAKAAQETSTQNYFTPVLGCEVTTSSGHFNAFPLQPESRVPDFRIGNWPALMENIRSTPGVEVVVLNHPCDVHNSFCPFAATNFNGVTGENRRGFKFGFDAIELINSGALRSDLMEPFHDWFALLNYGYRITGVGASDSHDVSRFIVGQGRTYIFCDDQNPSAINIRNACESLRRGKVLVSFGLITDMTVDDRFRVGDLATNLPNDIRVSISVLHASWVQADQLQLFGNGILLKETALDSSARTVTWTIPRPAHDTYLVAIAAGPGVRSPHWAIPKPYQPNSTVWRPRNLGATNPIWLDADGDGKFTSARDYAKKLVESADLFAMLAGYDQAVATQAAGLLNRSKFQEVYNSSAFKTAPTQVRKGFEAFHQSLLVQ